MLLGKLKTKDGFNMDKIIKKHIIYKKDVEQGLFYKKFHKYSKILDFESGVIITLENPSLELELRQFLLVERGEVMGKEGYHYDYIGRFGLKYLGSEKYLFEIRKE